MSTSSFVVGIIVVLLVVAFVFMRRHHASMSATKSDTSGSSASGSSTTGSGTSGSGTSGSGTPSALAPLTYVFNYFMWPSSAPGILVAAFNPPSAGVSSTAGPKTLPPSSYLNSKVAFSSPSSVYSVINPNTQVTTVTGTGNVPIAPGTLASVGSSSAHLWAGGSFYVHITGVPLLTGLTADTIYYSDNILATIGAA